MSKQTNLSLFDNDESTQTDIDDTSDIVKEELLIKKTSKSIKPQDSAIRIVSPSLIGMLLECPRCLWQYYNEGIKRPEGIFPSLPSGMDGVFKDYFDSYRTKAELPPEIKDKIKGKLYGNLSQLNQWRTNWTGITHKFENLKFMLRGAIDELIVSPEGEFIPFDFKTRGYPLKDDTHVHYQSQLNLYALLFEKNGFKVANHGYLLFFWPKNYDKSNVVFNTKLIKMDLNPDHGYELLKDVYKILEGPKPAPAPQCSYCIYKNTD